MKASRGACTRFEKLWRERDDRDLTAKEQAFVDDHIAICAECSEFAETSSLALGVLRSAALEPEVSPHFDERVVRKVRLDTAKQSLRYWSPALVGACIAFVAVFAALQIAADPGQYRAAHVPGGEARLDRSNGFGPSLILDEQPRLDR